MPWRLNVWESWDDPDNQAVLVKWKQRDIVFVFPIQWAHAHGLDACVVRAKERLQEFEGKAGRKVAPGSTLQAFSRHEEQPRLQTLNPEVPKALLPALPKLPQDN